MKLHRVTARNFQRATEFEVVLAGADVEVFGDNGTGKTTLANMYFWGLFGKDVYDRTDFKWKPLDADNREIHNLETSVELEFVDDDGKSTTFRRATKENWVRPRQGTKPEMQGHVTDYQVNGVPVRERDYIEQVRNMGGGEQQFRLLTDPNYFCSVMKWQDRRLTLVSAFGAITEAEVIDATPVLKPLKEMLEGRSIDDFRKVTEASRKRVNDELRDIPVRIDQETKGLPEVKPGDLQAEIDRYSEEVSVLERQRAEASSGGDVAKLRTEIANIDGKLIDLRNSARAVENPERTAALARKRSLAEQLDEKEAEARVIGRRTNEKRTDLARLGEKLESSRSEFRALNAQEWNGHTDCPTCGQALPEDKVAGARDKFNTDKAAKLEKLKNEGVAMRQTYNELEVAIARDDEVLSKVRADVESLKAQYEAVVIPEETAADVTTTEQYQDLMARRNLATKELQDIETGIGSRVEEINAQLSEVREKLRLASKAVSDASHRAAGLDRIKKLEDREKELSAQHEKLVHGLHLADEFVRAMVRMLTDRINSRFRIARWKLFEEQINGGLKECCEATVDGVPYGTLNTGGRVNVGLDVIDVLGREVGLSLPIFIDNCESVTRPLPTQGQQVRLVVSESDKSLRVVRTEDGQPVPVTTGAQRPKQEVLL